MALGLAQAGFVPSEFYDKDPDACTTLRHNIHNAPFVVSGHIIEGDLTELDWIPTTSPIRLLAAGAPCQPFSMGGSRRGHEDERNLFPIVLEAVRALHPRAVLIENVRGLGGASHHAYLEYILNQLRYPELAPREDETWEDHSRRLEQHLTAQWTRPTYHVQSAVFNAADFGVPQIRYRMFIVATEWDLPEYKFPTPTHSKHRLQWEQAAAAYWEKRGLHPPDEGARGPRELNLEENLLPWVTVRDAIEDLPLAAPEENNQCNNHWAIPGARAYPGHTGSLLDRPSKTLKAGVHGVPGGENMIVCDDGSVRYYTLREMARIQSFPDSHYFAGARSSVTRQIGNAVPCELAFQVARPLLKLFDGSSPSPKRRSRLTIPVSEVNSASLHQYPGLDQDGCRPPMA